MGDTPLHLLAEHSPRSVSVGRLLLAAGADPRARNTAGRTPARVCRAHGDAGKGLLALLEEAVRVCVPVVASFDVTLVAPAHIMPRPPPQAQRRRGAASNGSPARPRGTRDRGAPATPRSSDTNAGASAPTTNGHAPASPIHLAGGAEGHTTDAAAPNTPTRQRAAGVPPPAVAEDGFTIDDNAPTPSRLGANTGGRAAQPRAQTGASASARPAVAAANEANSTTGAPPTRAREPARVSTDDGTGPRTQVTERPEAPVRQAVSRQTASPRMQKLRPPPVTVSPSHGGAGSGDASEAQGMDNDEPQPEKQERGGLRWTLVVAGVVVVAAIAAVVVMKRRR